MVYCYLTMLGKWGNVRKLRRHITKQDPHKQRLLGLMLFCLVKKIIKRKSDFELMLGNVMFYALAQMLLQSENPIYTLKNT